MAFIMRALQIYKKYYACKVFIGFILKLIVSLCKIYLMVIIKNLNINFNKEVIYNDFSFTIKKSEKIAIVGESGKGKSTLLNMLVGFVPNFKGSVFINGIELNSLNISEIRKCVSWLPQDTSMNFTTVKELFFAPFNFALNKEFMPLKKDITKIFNEFELKEELLEKKVKEISGGQKQRIILASCLLLNKPLLLIDEPTSALDDKIKRKVADYILDKKNLTVIASTHDEYWMKKSDRIIKLT